MSRPAPARFAVLAAMAIAATALALPALADSTVAVTFQANNPWTQEIGQISHSDSYTEYSVQVQSGKTLQINLVTRDPNVFFKVRDESARKQLVDTYKTGATTWSTSTEAAGTYTIRVYADPAAIPRGDEAKYALQIGQYGKEDLRPASTAVAFQDGNPWVQEAGSLDSSGTAHDYTVAIAAGKTLQVNLVTRDTNVHFKVQDTAQGTTIFDSATAGANTWSTPVLTATDFAVQVYVDPKAVPPGSTVHYALQVGQFAQQAAQPVPATSASAPVAASSTNS